MIKSVNIKRMLLYMLLSSLALAAMYYFRMIPAIGHDIEFKFDECFNYRITAHVVQNGSVPETDHLSTYPDGKNIKEFLPVTMYQWASKFHKLINKFKKVRLDRSIFMFCSMISSLIYFPLYFISYEIYRNKIIAFATAYLAGIIPAYLHRTVCYWYRFEAIGTPILFISLLFFIKAFNKANDNKKTALYSMLSSVFLILSLYVWRLSILFLVVYFIVFIYIWILRRNFNKKTKIIFLLTVVLSFILFKFTPGTSGKSIAFNYGAFPRAILQVFMYRTGMIHEMSEFTRLVYYNRELCGTTVADLFKMPYLSLSIIFMLVYIFLYLGNKSNPLEKDIVFIFLIFFLMLTFLFLRNKIILGPIVALTLGDSVNFALKHKRNLKYALLIIKCAILIKTTRDSYKMAATRYPDNTNMNQYLKQALYVINDIAPKNAVMLCYWADGYPIQTYCNRPTLTDGLFESPEIVKRIIALSKIYYGKDESGLTGFCKKYGAAYLLVPENRKMAYAGYVGVNYDEYYPKGMPTAKARETVLYKLLYEPDKINNFELLFQNTEYRLYKIKT